MRVETIMSSKTFSLMSMMSSTTSWRSICGSSSFCTKDTKSVQLASIVRAMAASVKVPSFTSLKRRWISPALWWTSSFFFDNGEVTTLAARSKPKWAAWAAPSLASFKASPAVSLKLLNMRAIRRLPPVGSGTMLFAVVSTDFGAPASSWPPASSASRGVAAPAATCVLAAAAACSRCDMCSVDASFCLALSTSSSLCMSS
mmetsp:Transcript_69225/g.181360  ORF Transcript_69225/g.181360 Transcript_69225/m.181360 type:complete len:201 (+) Transcript_69225:1112-1714(+)